MTELLYTIIAIIIIAAALAASKGQKQRRFKYNPKEDWPFERKPILTKTESILFRSLIRALPNHLIFTQVQLSQLVKVKKGHDFKAWFNRISRMSADFVITDSNLTTITVIELDDASHNKPSRKEADAKKDKALQSAGINILRWKVGKTPSEPEIKHIFNTLSQQTNPANSRQGCH